MFAEAGCDDGHISEQAVKGSKVPNVMCILPGTTDKVIVVGAHFDYVRAGDGVVDNWSGASLLPSIYEAITIEPLFAFFAKGGTDTAGSAGVDYDRKSHGTGSIVPALAKKRKDGAPTVSLWEKGKLKAGPPRQLSVCYLTAMFSYAIEMSPICCFWALI